MSCLGQDGIAAGREGEGALHAEVVRRQMFRAVAGVAEVQVLALSVEPLSPEKL